MDIQGLMRGAQEMQKKMQKAKEEISKKTFEGSSGGGMVTITVSGDVIAKKINIDSTLVNIEEKDILEDLLVAAFNDAKKKAEDESESSMKSIAGGMQLPAGFNM
ncbi:MAG: DNA-binding YbaB/EbfC family protein [Lentimonas sp.]|jgi:DNA-binding YbaB/EbfC family protein